MPRLGFTSTDFCLEPSHSWLSPLARMIDNDTVASTDTLCTLCERVGMTFRPMVI